MPTQSLQHGNSEKHVGFKWKALEGFQKEHHPLPKKGRSADSKHKEQIYIGSLSKAVLFSLLYYRATNLLI